MEVSPIRRPSLADIAEQKIRQAIRESGLGPGDMLPSEMELAKHLGISRNVVREALSRLRMLGVLDTRKRRGMKLVEPDILGGLARVLDLPVLNAKIKSDLLELRIIIELGLVDFVFLRKTEKDLEELERIVKKEEKNPEDPAVAIDCDIAFHSKLYKMAGNGTVERFQALLSPFFQWQEKKGFLATRFEDPKDVTHRDLLDLLRDGTVTKFRACMRKHMKPHIGIIEESRG